MVNSFVELPDVEFLIAIDHYFDGEKTLMMKCLCICLDSYCFFYSSVVVELIDSLGTAWCSFMTNVYKRVSDKGFY